MRCLVTSHLRLVVRIARSYRGYGHPIAELTAEGNIGLLKAVARFDPDHGSRLATYAACWIRAVIMDYIMRSWSLVRFGSTAAQRKLFFNLRRLTDPLPQTAGEDLPSEMVKQIARALKVRESDVVTAHRRLTAPDCSLNRPPDIPESGDSGDWLAMLGDRRPNQETLLAERNELSYRVELLRKAFRQLDRREREIVVERYLKDKSAKLSDLGLRFSVTSERIRQVEARALEKIQRAVTDAGDPDGRVPHTDRSSTVLPAHELKDALRACSRLDAGRRLSPPQQLRR